MTVKQKSEKKDQKQKEEQPFSLAVSTACSLDQVVLRLEWTATPNWIQHPVFLALHDRAVSKMELHGQMVVYIELVQLVRILTVFLAEDLQLFEQALTRQGINTREELLAFFQDALEEADNKGGLNQ